MSWMFREMMAASLTLTYAVLCVPLPCICARMCVCALKSLLGGTGGKAAWGCVGVSSGHLHHDRRLQASPGHLALHSALVPHSEQSRGALGWLWTCHFIFHQTVDRGLSCGINLDHLYTCSKWKQKTLLFKNSCHHMYSWPLYSSLQSLCYPGAENGLSPWHVHW